MDMSKNFETSNYATNDILLQSDTPQVVITGMEVSDEPQVDTGVEEQFDTSVVGVSELRTTAESITEQDDQPTTQLVISPPLDAVLDNSTLVQADETAMLPTSIDEAPVVEGVAELEFVSASSEVTAAGPLTEVTSNVDGEEGEKHEAYSEGAGGRQEDEPLEPMPGGTDNIDPPDDNVGVSLMDGGDDPESRDPYEGTGDTHNPDRPYEGDLVTHPVSGEPMPAWEILDQLHMFVRARELIEQADNPRPEPVPIPEQDVPDRAFDTLMDLQEKVGGWPLTSEQVTEENKILRTYDMEQVSSEFPGKIASFTAQLSYENESATVPEFGNLSIHEPTVGWPREYYFQANTVPTYEGDEPKIYYDDYPWHQETLGRPERNTEFGLQQAQRMIARAPHYRRHAE